MPVHSTLDLDAAINRIARSQLGLITAKQAEDVGVGRQGMHARLIAGSVDRVFVSVFRIVAVAPTIEQRILAAALAVPGSTVAAMSAATTLGFPLPKGFVGVGSDVTLCVAANRVVRRHGIRVIQCGRPLPDAPWLSVRRATPASTLIQLARFVDADILGRCIDHCIIHRLVTVDLVRRLVEERPNSVSGRRKLLEQLEARSTGLKHRSKLELKVARWLRQDGLAGWKANWHVCISASASVEVDFAWVERRVALEVSPFFTHGSKSAQLRDAQRRRQLQLAGWTVIEASDGDVVDRHSFSTTAEALRKLLK